MGQNEPDICQWNLLRQASLRSRKPHLFPLSQSLQTARLTPSVPALSLAPGHSHQAVSMNFLTLIWTLLCFFTGYKFPMAPSNPQRKLWGLALDSFRWPILICQTSAALPTCLCLLCNLKGERNRVRDNENDSAGSLSTRPTAAGGLGQDNVSSPEFHWSLQHG